MAKTESLQARAREMLEGVGCTHVGRALDLITPLLPPDTGYGAISLAELDALRSRVAAIQTARADLFKAPGEVLSARQAFEQFAELLNDPARRNDATEFYAAHATLVQAGKAFNSREETARQDREFQEGQARNAHSQKVASLKAEAVRLEGLLAYGTEYGVYPGTAAGSPKATPQDMRAKAERVQAIKAEVAGLEGTP